MYHKGTENAKKTGVVVSGAKRSQRTTVVLHQTWGYHPEKDASVSTRPSAMSASDAYRHPSAAG